MADLGTKNEEGSEKLAQVPGELHPAGSAVTATLLMTTLLASLGSFNFGYNIGVVNTPARTFRECPADASVWACFAVTGDEWSYIPAVMCAGAIVGSLMAGQLTGKIGRLRSVLVANIPYIIGMLVMALATTYWMLMLGRIFVGVGVGMACITVPLYLTEISPIAIRGLIGSVHQLMICFGLLVVEILGALGFSQPYYWRGMLALDLIPCLLQVVGLLLVGNESPRFLIARGRAAEGEAALASLRSHHYDPEELEQIVKNAESDRSSESWGLRELFLVHRREASKSMIAASLLHIGQQVSGINSILFFSSDIFSSSPTTSSSLVPVFIAILNMVMTVFAIAMIDKAGRRFLALSSTSIMFVSAVALTMGFVIDKTPLSIVAVLFFVGSFAFGLGPIPWLMTNEIFPTQAAAVAVSLAVCLNWTFNLLVTGTFSRLRDLLGDYTFVPHAACILLLFLFIYKFVPETHGRPVGFI